MLDPRLPCEIYHCLYLENNFCGYFDQQSEHVQRALQFACPAFMSVDQFDKSVIQIENYIDKIESDQS
jgi:hypothetical protein